jgi:hypothetical protein
MKPKFSDLTLNSKSIYPHSCHHLNQIFSVKSSTGYCKCHRLLEPPGSSSAQSSELTLPTCWQRENRGLSSMFQGQVLGSIHCSCPHFVIQNLSPTTTKMQEVCRIWSFCVSARKLKMAWLNTLASPSWRTSFLSGVVRYHCGSLLQWLMILLGGFSASIYFSKVVYSKQHPVAWNETNRSSNPRSITTT